MRYQPVDSPWGINPSPEEVALDGWLDNSDPYLSLRVAPDRIRAKRVRPEAADLAPQPWTTPES